MSQLPRRAVMLARMDCRPEDDAAFNAWYWDEHIPERLAIPGMLAVARFMRAQSPRYLAWYNLADAGVVDSPAFTALHRSRTPRTVAMLAAAFAVAREIYHELGSPALPPGIDRHDGGLLLHDLGAAVTSPAELVGLATVDTAQLAGCGLGGVRCLARADDVVPSAEVLQWVPKDHPRFLCAHLVPAGLRDSARWPATAGWSLYRRLAP